MAQGALKKAPKLTGKPAKSQPRQHGLALKKGTKVLKPKSKRATKSAAADKISKKYAGALVAKTEALLGERAGHLELIGKGGKGDKSKGANKTKGGTRKFG